MANKIRAYKNHYQIDGKRYDRVTAPFDAVQPKFLVDWKLEHGKDEAQRLSKEAMAIGSRVDALAQEIMAGKPISVSDEPVEVKNCLEGFRRWLAEEKPQVTDWQKTLVDKTYEIAGTYDIRCGNTIVDIKCAGKISPTYWLQVAVYAWMYGQGIDKIGILRLDKMTSDYEYVVRDFDLGLVDIYKGLLKYYRYIKGVDDEVTGREE